MVPNMNTENKLGDSATYRQVLRTYFKMDTKELEITYAHLKDTDPESYDELIYDEEAMNCGLNVIYSETKDDERFCELYRLAAGKFLTEDLEIGLCVLFTYDYFADFIEFYENRTDELYMKLLTRL